MIVVSDTSPLSALAAIQQLDLLPMIYGKITIPRAVLDECRHPKAPETLREWSACPPTWAVLAGPCGTPPTELANLDPGETEAIMIAMTSPPPVLLLIDERRGVKTAKHFGLPSVGTLGLLVNARLLGLLDFDSSLEQLRATSFHVGQSTILRARHIIDANSSI